MRAVEKMKKFVEPESVALFGVSRRTGEGSYNMLEHLLGYGYQGRIYPINPNTNEILGVKTHSRIADISDNIDLAIINLPRSLVPRIVRECAVKGIKSIMIATQGFADANDEKGKRMQKEIDEVVRNDGVRILGPNSLGVANPFINFSSSFVKINMAKVPIGVICQTGAFFGFGEPNLLGKGIDLGNACDVNFAESLAYYEQDAETKVIALHIEGAQDGKEFIEAVKRVTLRKPVLVFKTGRSQYAARAIQSHTGSLAGTDEIWEAALRQAGAIRVADLEELGDATNAFHLLPLMKGRRIGIVTTSGGVGVMTIDACSQFGMEMAELSPSTIKRISVLSPPWQSIGNPLDIWPTFIVQKQPFTKVVTEGVGAVPNRQTCNHLCQILTELAEVHRDKPMVCCLFGNYAGEAKSRMEATGRIMVFQAPHRAIRVLGHLAKYSAFRRGF